MTTISVLGLGAMGSALAKAFLKNGYATTVWNRTEAKADALVAQGASKASTIEQAIEASDTLVLCVVTNDVVHAILDEAKDAIQGKTIVNLTNGTPNQARDLAVRATKHHAEYLDGGIMAVPPMIGTEAGYVLYSGPQPVFERLEKTLRALGGTKYVGADAGLAALYDLALLTGMYGQTIGQVQALALIRSAGVEAEGFMRDLLDPWMKAMAAFSTEFAQQVDAGNHTENVVSPLGMQAAAFHNLIDAAGEQGVSADLFKPLQSLLNEAVDQGHDNADLSVLVDLLRR
ncbi:NAD(P)-dependent oxidoreductase [Tenggerimyces flavus]|uniref:NAD(P)-dependent oxidoreductase n=1 Tax=Tenggerimyces flavus TaxID=1708749 RepID=A0ABV7YHF5_9ACTN|nr:NAD(P)-binding domain-containing protein [Tenggerimyces flavus]MBM7784539.1 3-hydroxyisobutyrate dehydrogenase-like beta-hydroxyacid dehydrogenase [Tenggerimyces flavus]